MQREVALVFMLAVACSDSTSSERSLPVDGSMGPVSSFVVPYAADVLAGPSSVEGTVPAGVKDDSGKGDSGKDAAGKDAAGKDAAGKDGDQPVASPSPAPTPAPNSQNGSVTAPPPVTTTSIRFNGVELILDKAYGTVRGLKIDGVGEMLSASRDQAQLFTISYPWAGYFLPLNLAANLSDATWTSDPVNGVTLTWAKLRLSRPTSTLTHVPVAASVHIRGHSEGLAFSLEVTNNGPKQAMQVFFPDLAGLHPVKDAAADTVLRFAKQPDTTPTPGVTCGEDFACISYPFVGPAIAEDRSPYYVTSLWRRYRFIPTARWVALESVASGGMLITQESNGGLAFGAQKPVSELMVHRDEGLPDALRLAWRHEQRVDRGQTWASGLFVIKPNLR